MIRGSLLLSGVLCFATAGFVPASAATPWPASGSSLAALHGVPAQRFAPVPRQPMRGSAFVPGRLLTGPESRVLPASRRRPRALPACVPFTVTFPSDVGQPPNTPTTLTAAEVNPTSPTGAIDATGCDVGIYLSSAVNGRLIQNVQIHDANQFGILGVGARNVAIFNATITRIGNHDPSSGLFDPNGVQTGVGIDFEGGSATILGAVITQYQKNGTAFDFGASVSISNSSIVGLGVVNYIAQNGVQWYEAPTPSAVGVTVTANHYDNPQDQLYNGEATGFLVLCTNLQPALENVLFGTLDRSYNNDINDYISNNTTNGDCLPGYKT